MTYGCIEFVPTGDGSEGKQKAVFVVVVRQKPSLPAKNKNKEIYK